MGCDWCSQPQLIWILETGRLKKKSEIYYSFIFAVAKHNITKREAVKDMKRSMHMIINFKINTRRQ